MRIIENMRLSGLASSRKRLCQELANTMQEMKRYSEKEIELASRGFSDVIISQDSRETDIQTGEIGLKELSIVRPVLAIEIGQVVNLISYDSNLAVLVNGAFSEAILYLINKTPSH